MAMNEIKELITTSTQFVGRGVEAVGSAGKALTSMVERVSHISSLVTGIADGALRADGELIYTATDLRVGLFEADAEAVGATT